MNLKKEINKDEIETLIPHRKPFLLIDKLTDIKLLDEYKQNYQNKEVILSTKLKRNGIKYDDNNYFLYKNDQNSFIPISLFIKKSFFLELGGFDKSFITCMADADLIYRAVSSNKAAFSFVFIIFSAIICITNLNYNF